MEPEEEETKFPNGQIRQRTFHIAESPTKLHRLRYHLASEGCSESQTSLARTLLQEATDSKFEKSANAELAVRWLLMAASEGHEEAYRLLETCYKSGIGVSKSNREQIESCLNSTNNEKMAHRIGQSLYRLLAYDIKEPVPLLYFQRKIDLFLRDEPANEVDEETDQIELNEDPNYISVFDVVSSIQQCLDGSNPTITISKDYTAQINRKGYFNAILFGLYQILRFCQRCQSNLNDLSIVFAIFFAGIIMFTITLFFLPSLKVNDFMFVVEILKNWVRLLSLAVMLFVSSNLLNRKSRGQNMEKWSRVVRKFDNNAVLKRYNLKPKDLAQTLLLFLATVTFILFSETKLDWLVWLHMYLPSIIFLFVALTTMKMDLFNVSFTMHSLIASLKFLVLVLPFLNIPLLEIPFSNSAVVCISPLVLLILIALFLHAYLATRFTAQWQLIHIPRIIWLGLIINSAFASITLSSLAMDLFFWVGVFLLSYKFEPITSFSIVLALSAVLISDANSYVRLLTLCSILLTVMFKSISERLLLVCRLWKIVASSIVVLIVLFSFLFSSDGNSDQQQLSWTEYSTQCHKMAWLQTNMVQVQMDCEDFYEASVSLVGNVHSVKRTSAINRVESCINLLPNSLARWMKCRLGEEKYPRGENRCNLGRFSYNRYEITIEIKGTFRVEAAVVFQTDDRCRDFILNIREGDSVTMVGRLINGMGTDKPVFELDNGSCLTCEESCICHVNNENFKFLKNISFANLYKYFLEPFVYFKHV